VRILIPVSDSPYAEHALHFGGQIAAGSGDPPTLLTVVRHERSRPRGERILEDARRSADRGLPGANTRVRVGHPAEEILREAEGESFDLIIMGEREKRGIATRFALGATSERVVEHAPCPVVIAKGTARPIRRILVCDSGAGNPNLAEEPLPPVLSRFTSQLVGMLKGEERITVLHVMSQISAGPGVDGHQLRAATEELMAEPSPEGALLHEDLQLLRGKGAHVEGEIRHGFVVDEILEEARGGDYDLVVIGAHRGGGWQRILLDDIAHKLIAEVDRPILVVR
jgi:nucleotide-binding universal stress UspA family protein